MNYLKKNILLSVFFIICMGVSACNLFEVEKVTSPNSPSSSVILEDATRPQLQNLVNGLESAHRLYLPNWWELVGSFGRETYNIQPSDPRFAVQWLQYQQIAVPAEQNHFFFVDAGGYVFPYGAVRQANLLILAVQNTDVVTEQESNGYVGLARTIKAYQLLIPLMHQYTQGIRIALPYTKPLKPGPFLGYDEALAEIRNILDKGAENLSNAGNSLSFELSAGFDGFATPEGLLKVNRAIAARAAIYAEDWQGALNALSNSFLTLQTGHDVMWMGPAHTFSGGLDRQNPLFFLPNTQPPVVVPSPDWIADAEPGDERVDNKVLLRDEPIVTPDIPAPNNPGVSFAYQIALYDTRTSPIPFIRNEELILIYAEAKAQLGQLQNAVDAINLIRNTWGLNDFSSTNKADIIDQILHERRYSLWSEGHRWIDMRRYGRLDEIETALDGGRVPMYVGRPQGEIDWECYENPETCQ